MPYPSLARSCLLLAILLGLAAAWLPAVETGTSPAASSPAGIRSGTVWTDTKGEAIQAHGIGMLRVGNTYYWFGERRLDNGPCRAIRCYASTDLAHWTFRNTVLSSQSHPALAEARCERPKVLYNPRTKKYVLWAHKENTRDYREARAVVAVCDTPDGNYAYVKDFRPFGNESRDCTLFADDDGAAYFISAARGNADLVCYKLTADYLDVQSQSVMMKGVSREAPAVFKRNGLYYVITSGCTAFGPNSNQYATARKITGPYGPLSVLCSRKTWNTYCSQSAFVLPVAGSRATTFVFMADRWKGWNLPDSRYVFLPLQFGEDGTIVPVEWSDAWNLDAATGECSFPAAPEPAARNLARGKPCEASVRNEQDGNEASAAFDENPRTRWCADDGDYPHWLKVDLGADTAVSRSEIVWEAGKARIYKYVIESSRDGATWTTVVDRSNNKRQEPTQVDQCAATGRYFRLNVLGCDLPEGGYAWASLFEWRLFSGDRNVAKNRPAVADSQQDGTYGTKANDGDFTTTWFTGKPTLGNWWKVDLGESHKLTGCRLMWHDPGFWYQYRIEVSADGRQWTTAVDMTQNTEVKWVPSHKFAADARWLRITVTGMENGCWLGIREVEVFE
ncbi:MAG: discoidin domain-containing protein [Pirellulales bacterium]